MYYEELARRLLGLVIGLEGRIPAEQTEWLHEVTRVGEYGLAPIFTKRIGPWSGQAYS